MLFSCNSLLFSLTQFCSPFHNRRVLRPRTVLSSSHFFHSDAFVNVAKDVKFPILCFGFLLASDRYEHTIYDRKLMYKSRCGQRRRRRRRRRDRRKKYLNCVTHKLVFSRATSCELCFVILFSFFLFASLRFFVFWTRFNTSYMILCPILSWNSRIHSWLVSKLKFKLIHWKSIRRRFEFKV